MELVDLDAGAPYPLAAPPGNHATFSKLTADASLGTAADFPTILLKFSQIDRTHLRIPGGKEKAKASSESGNGFSIRALNGRDRRQ